MKSERTPLIKGQFTPIDASSAFIKASHEHFAFQIPANILVEMQNLDPGEWRCIRKSAIESWERAHKEWEAAADLPIRQFLEARRTFDPLIPDQCDADDFVAELLKAGERGSDRRIKEAVLRLAKSSYFRTLNIPGIMPLVQSAVQMAVEDNDHEFFKRFGRELEKPASPYKPPKEQTPLERLLMAHWITDGDIGLHFCCFSDQALDDFLRLVAPKSAPSLDAVRKTRQRLQLKQTKRKLVKTVEHTGDWIVLG